ncbi:MAG: beta-Ala-His dipeptidase [Candidatus Heimdallarchaeota archaeon]
MVNGKLSELEPKLVWEIFEQITQVPRESKKEEKIRTWVKDWARKNNVDIKNEDKTGNILLAAKATKGCEKYPTLIIQAHMDMVCQKNANYEIDFDNDPIITEIQDNIVTAKGTTLGADNGIGMAFGLAALIDEELQHGPLEVLLTVDEETGLTGAFAVTKGFFSGKYLLNVDSESIGSITISSAGGGDTDFVLPITMKEQEDFSAINITIAGLSGGHSGVDIDLPKLNAIKVGVDALLNTPLHVVRLYSITGGSAHNAIPRDFEAIILVPKKEKKEAMNALKTWKKRTLNISKEIEPNITIEIKESNEKKACTNEQTKAIIGLLDDINHGPLTYSKEIVGLVQTSSNLAVVKTEGKSIHVNVSTRSSDNTELDEVRAKLVTTGEKYEAKVTLEKAYPGWKPQPDSAFLQLVKKQYQEVTNSEVKLEAIHAGLECGMFLVLDDELQVASIGPNINNAHSPDESLEIDSVGLLWNVIKKIIENLGSL